jgi:hypothetical protein
MMDDTKICFQLRCQKIVRMEDLARFTPLPLQMVNVTIRKGPGGSVSWGALDSQPQEIKFTSYLFMFDGSLRYSGFFHHLNWSP